MSFVVVNAIRHALDSARKESTKKDETEFYHLGSPSAPEHIFLTANNTDVDYLLY
jgi:hypothetical protein